MKHTPALRTLLCFLCISVFLPIGSARAQDIFSTVAPNSNGSDTYVDIKNATGGNLYFFNDPIPSAARMARVSGGSVFPWPSIGNFTPDPQAFQQNRLYSGEYLRVYPKTLSAGSEIQVEFSYAQLGTRYRYRITVVAGARVDIVSYLDPIEASMASTVRWRVTFDQPISNVTAANLALETGIVGASIASVTPDAAQPSANWTVTANTGNTVGSIRLLWVGHRTETPSVPNPFVTQFPYQFGERIFFVQDLPTEAIVILPNTTRTLAFVGSRRSGQELFNRWYVIPPGSTTPVAIPGATNHTYAPPDTYASYTPPAYASGTYQYFCSVFGSPGQEFSNFLYTQTATVSVLTLNAAAQAGFTNTTGTAAYNLTTAAGPSVAGGTFSGNGVSGDMFNPASAGIGVHTITYAVGGVQVSFTITVNEQPSMNVTTTTDVVNNRDGLASLREALAYAQSLGGARTVTFAAALAGQTITVSNGWNDANDDTALRVSGNVTVDGGSGVTINLAAPVARRIFLSGGTLTLRNLKLSGGNIQGSNDGGALWSTGTATLESVQFTNNKANSGGAVETLGTLTVRNCTFNGNYAQNDGGALHAGGSSLTIDNSTFSGNSAGTVASAIAGGAQQNTYRYLTITNNSGGAGAITSYFYPTTIVNSIVDGNSPDGIIQVAGGTITAQSTNNIFGSGGTGALTNGVNGNLTNVPIVQLHLGPLGNNAGSTQTIALLPGSLAIDAGFAIGGVTSDQRGLARPQGAAPDIGAFEGIAPPVVTVNPENQAVPVGGTATFHAMATMLFGGAAPSTLSNGAVLLPNQYLLSTNHAYQLLYQADGNLVLYRGDGVALWGSGTAGQAPGHVNMQADGNLVVYGPGGVPQYATGTAGNPNAVLALQNDGNLVLYASVPVFATNTVSFAPFNPVPTVQWQVSTDHGATFTDIPGATGVTLSFTAALADNDNRYRAVFTNGSGVAVPTTSATVTILIPQAPSITSPSSATFAVGASGTFQFTGSGYPAPTFAISGTPPNGVTFNDSNGILSGTPAAGSGGSYPLTITASNGVGSNPTQSFTLTVNEAPTITTTNVATFVVGTSGNFAMSASGFPAPTFSTASTLPSGVILSAAGVLSGTPAAGSGGTYPLSITASNGTGNDATQSVTLTVTEPVAITSGNATTLIVGTAGGFALSASGYPAPMFNTTGPLPNGVGLSAVGVLSGTPMPGTGGVYHFTVTASNGSSADATQEFTLTINQAPSITSTSSAAFTVGNFARFTVETSGFPAATLSVEGTLPSGITFAPASGILSGIPANNAVGNYPITFKATNGVGSDATQSFTLMVNDAVCVATPNDLVAWFPGEGDATEVKNGINGSVLNGAGFAAGKVEQGFTFNGGTSIVQAPDNAAWNFGANDFTIETWVNFSAVSGSDVLVAHSEGSGSVNKWIFWLKNGKLEFHLDGSAVANITSDATFTPVLGQWHHVAVTRSGNAYKFYVDGVQNGGDRFDANSVPLANAPLTLGKAESLNALSGMLDELQIFSRALSASEIASVYNSSVQGFCTETPQALAAVSRKTHGAVGDFDVPLPLTGAPGVECRSGGVNGNHTIVITFNNVVTDGTATVNAGSVSGTPVFTLNTMKVNLTGISNAQSIIVTLNNVRDGFGQTLPSVSIPIDLLLGDANASKSVTASDVSQVKALAGSTVDAAKLRCDFNTDGSVNASDVSQVKAASGTIIP